MPIHAGIGNKPINMLCEYRQNPLGIDEMSPRFSWQLNDSVKGTFQTAYQIHVSLPSNDFETDEFRVWDSGKVLTQESVNNEYQGDELKSCTRYYWKVRIWDEHGNVSPWSDTNWFEMGVLDQDIWQSEWISMEDDLARVKTMPYCPYFRKSVVIDSSVKKARVYASALGMYEIYINGKQVSEDIFMPGWTDYTKRIQYNTYDITDYFHLGVNIISAVCGSGWYCGHLGWHGDSKWYGDKPHFFAQARLEHADGSISTIKTDRSWKVSKGPIIESDIYKGETYDARMEMYNWQTSEFDDKLWMDVESQPNIGTKLVAAKCQNIRRIEKIEPVSITETFPGKFVIDFGQNILGRVRILVKGIRGTRITIRHSETIKADGSMNAYPLRGSFSVDTYILEGDRIEVYEPHFTFHGFRYVELSGYPGTPDPKAIHAIVIHADMQFTGTFSCSNDLINQLHKNIIWTQRSTYLDIPLDCPSRDEKLGWLGDNCFFLRAACFNMNIASITTKWIQDIFDSQREDGYFRFCAPYLDKFMEDTGWNEEYLGGWSDPGLIIPWVIYLHYGDKRVLERYYDKLKLWVDYLVSLSNNLIQADYGIGDWLSIDLDRNDLSFSQGSYVITPPVITNTAYFAYCCNLMAKVAEALGYDNDHNKYSALFIDVKNAFNNEFVSPNGRIMSNTQTAYVIALAFDLLPEEKCKIALKYLYDDIYKRGWHLSTGFVGTTFILDALTKHGDIDTAYRLLLNERFPSWLYQVKHGATSLWERWNGWTEDKGYHTSGVNSFNHSWSGSVDEWLYKVIAGIRFDESETGFKHIIINPRPGGGIEHAYGEYISLYGSIISSWKIKNSGFQLTVKIPPNTRATIKIPSSKLEDCFANGQPISESSEVTNVVFDNNEVSCESGSGEFEFSSILM